VGDRFDRHKSGTVLNVSGQLATMILFHTKCGWVGLHGIAFNGSQDTDRGLANYQVDSEDDSSDPLMLNLRVQLLKKPSIPKSILRKTKTSTQRLLMKLLTPRKMFIMMMIPGKMFLIATTVLRILRSFLTKDCLSQYSIILFLLTLIHPCLATCYQYSIIILMAQPIHPINVYSWLKNVYS
jgi:hypothetical protein